MMLVLSPVFLYMACSVWPLLDAGYVRITRSMSLRTANSPSIYALHSFWSVRILSACKSSALRSWYRAPPYSNTQL